MYMNSCNLIGRVGNDPKFFEGKDGDNTKDRLLVTLMINKPKSETADAVTCVLWGATARAGAKYISKGKMLGVEGRISSQYNREKGINYTQVSATMVHYGPDSEKNKNSKEASTQNDTSEVDALAARLAAKVQKAPSHKDNLVALKELLMEKHNLSEADADAVLADHVKELTRTATATVAAAPPTPAPTTTEDTDAPF